MTTENTPIPGTLNNVIRIDDEQIRGHLDRVVRGTVEETLNALLESELIGFAMRNVTSERRLGVTPELGTTSVISRRRQAR